MALSSHLAGQQVPNSLTSQQVVGDQTGSDRAHLVSSAAL